MSTLVPPFEKLFSDLAGVPPLQAIDQLIELYRDKRQPFELFESMKMRTRLELGLPPVAFETQPTPDEVTQRKLEDGLLDACRAAGTMLLSEGRIREGWMYLRPVGDLQAAARLLAAIPATDENSEDLIAVLLHEGVDVGRGYRLLLERNGTCNSITTFEQVLASRPKEQQRAAATILLNHVYQELASNVLGDIERRENKAPAEHLSLVELLAGRRQLLEGGAYHLDTSHLAATVRFARVLNDPRDWQKAWELSQYGRQLNPQLQYAGEEPFKEVYPTHSTFFSVLLDRQRDVGLAYFERKARSLDSKEHGTEAIETYIDLLDRVGRPLDALKAAVAMIPEEVPLGRIIGWLLDLSRRGNGKELLLSFCQQRSDPIAFAATLF